MINELTATLKQVLGLNKPTSECLLQIMMAMVMQRTVNLKKLACSIRGEADVNSQYRRLQRFFAKVSFPQHVFARLMAGLFFFRRNSLIPFIRSNQLEMGQEGLKFSCTQRLL